MTKLDLMIEYLGWQGGTIHDAIIAVENDLIAEKHNLYLMENNLSAIAGIDKAYYSPGLMINCRKRIKYLEELLAME